MDHNWTVDTIAEGATALLSMVPARHTNAASNILAEIIGAFGTATENGLNADALAHDVAAELGFLE